MKKIYLILAAAVGMTITSCTTNDYVGEVESNPQTVNDGSIRFGTATKGMTRADHVGADAASLLNNKFIVGGFKGTYDYSGTPTVENVTVATGKVFDNYIVQWGANTAGTTTSNTSDWEYVGITAAAPSGIAGNNQSIKYWDYTASQYDFIAYSTGNASIVTSGTAAEALAASNVLVTAITPTTAKTSAYTLAGKAEDLAKCYIADMVTVYKDGTDGMHYQDEVQLTFRSLASKVRMAIYETIPGYSVKDVKFYTNATTYLDSETAGDKIENATLFTTGSTAKDNFYTAGTYTVKFPTIGKSNVSESDYNKAHASFAIVGEGKTTTKAFGTLQKVGRDYREADATNYIGRTATTASFAGTTAPYYQIAMPNEDGTVLELRVDYTLLSIDGSGEEIHVYGATAFVPAIYAAWKSNYAYTYIFKISDNTNGWTSTVDSDPAGLYPITFDAVVTETQDFTQSNITNVASPSITTYQKGHVYTDNEYDATRTDKDIYVQVMADGTLKADLDSKGKLYVVTPRTGKTITEAEVMDALNIYVSSTGTPLVVTGRNEWVLTDATSSASVDATITEIPGADGNVITVTTKTAAKFTPTAGTTYAYVYDATPTPAPGSTYYYSAEALTSEPSDWGTAGVWYKDPNGTTAVDTYADGTYYKKYTNLNKVYGVKVIKVKE